MRFPGKRRRDLNWAEIETFLGEMARRTEISDWAIAQARDAPGMGVRSPLDRK